MKIGVVTASYPRVAGEHAGNFVAAHVDAMRAAGHDVDVIGAHTIASELFYRAGAPDALERGGLRTYLAAARFSVELTREVARRSSSWDLVIAHWLVPSALAAMLAAPRRTPILAIAHGGDVHTLRRLRLLAPALYLLRARGVKLAFVSRELREIARSAAPRLSAWLDEALVQPMGIDVARFASLPRAARGGPRRVAVVGRLVPVKGIDVAIRALAHVTTTDVELVIAGDGPERATLEALARSQLANGGTPRRVTFLGAVDSRTRDQLLSEAACVVVPSRTLANGRSEGTPLIAIEALAAGVPVIATDVGGLHDLPELVHLHRDAGVLSLVPAEDPRALAAAIDRSLASPPDARADLSAFDRARVAVALFDHVLGTREPAQSAAKPPICETRDSNRRRTA